MLSNWINKAKQDYDYFIQNLNHVKQVQQYILQNILNKNSNTRFGKEHDFKSITGIKDYQKTVPVRGSNDFTKYFNSAQRGKKSILTQEDIILFEPTSGTTSGIKLIPYTHSLKKEFQNSINVWLYDLLVNYPDIINGRQYWSVSPVTHQNSFTSGNIKIGFENDAEYFDWDEKTAGKLFAVPSEIRFIESIENFRYLTAFYLLHAKDLSFISIWHPTFLLLILECIENYKELLLKDLYDGSINLPVYGHLQANNLSISQAKERSRELAKLFSSNKKEIYRQIWPNLKLISCWKDKLNYFENLKSFFPDLDFQAKGLLATEGIISIPLVESQGAVPAFNSHFLEFLPDDDVSYPKLINELEKGKNYTVVITTGGGLYRYNLRDTIKVSGFYKGLPVIEFTGRENTLDFVGEKLDEPFIENTISILLSKYRITATFMLFAPVKQGNEMFYTLFLETGNKITPEMSDELDDLLRKNYHYNYARNISQLQMARVCKIRNGLKAYIGYKLTRGQILGNVKVNLIDKDTRWGERFEIISSENLI